MYQKIALVIATTFIFSPGALLTPQYVYSMPSASVQANAPSVTGTILETMNASGYTYMLVESNSQKNWVAIPAAQVTKGSEVSYLEGMVMRNFTSQTLDRTFESIIFSPGLTNQEKLDSKPAKTSSGDSFEAALLAESNAAPATPALTESGGSASAIIPLQEISIAKSSAENGHTVSEIFEQAQKLNGQKVSVQGKVVKFSPNIMGRHWVHIQDGTGNPMENSHDLVITTAEEVAVDNIVTFEGVVTADKDFGAGYKYVVLIEKAAVIQ